MADTEKLRQRLEEMLKDHLGVSELVTDAEGDYPVRAGSAKYHRRLSRRQFADWLGRLSRERGRASIGECAHQRPRVSSPFTSCTSRSRSTVTCHPRYRDRNSSREMWSPFFDDAAIVRTR